MVCPKRVSLNIIQSLWLFIATTLVLLAVLLSALRLSLPYVSTYKDDISQFIVDEFNVNLEFGQVIADWNRLGPNLHLSKIKLNDVQQSSAVTIAIENVIIEIDFWQSIKQRELVADNFILDQVSLFVDPDALSQMSTEGTDDQKSNLLDTISPLFLDHLKAFDVTRSNINVAMKDGTYKRIDIKLLTWLNDESRHQAAGQLSLADVDAGKFKFILDLNGEKSSELSGQLYLDSNGINLASFLSTWVGDEITEIKSHLPFEAWLNIENGRAKSLIGRIKSSINDENNYLQWQRGSQTHQLEFQQGLLEAEFSEQKNQFVLHDFTLIDSYGVASSISLDVISFSHGRTYVQAQDIYLKPILELSDLFELPSPINSQFIQGIDERLRLKNSYLIFDNVGEWRLVGEFDNIGWRGQGYIPYLNNWQASYAADPSGIVVELAAEKTSFSIDALYDEPFILEQASALLSVSNVERDWQLKIEDVDLQLKDNRIIGDLQLFPNYQQEIELRLFAQADVMDANKVKQFLPKKAIGDDVYNYIANAIKGGLVKDARVLWHGQLNQFPYTNNGIFRADVNLSEGVFKFQPDWPSATDIDVSLSFINEGLYFKSDHAFLKGAKLLSLDAGIENLVNQPSLNLSANISATGQAATDVMNNSMLKSTVGAALKELQVSGNLSAQLKLFVPLVKNDEKLSVTGQVRFDDNEVKVATPGFNFSQLNGLLNFDLDKLSAEKIKFRWGQADFVADLNSFNNIDTYQVDLALSSVWDSQHLLAAYGFNHLSKLSEGEVDWQGDLRINLPRGGFNYEFNADFDLERTRLDLPKPYKKTKGQQDKFIISAQGDAGKSIIHAHMRDILSFDAVLPHQTKQFSRAYLVLGEAELGAPGQGFNVSAHLPDIILDDYIAFVTDLVSDINSLPSKNGAGPALIGKPDRIRGVVGQMQLGPLAWQDVGFDISSEHTTWLAKVKAKEFRGDILLSEDWLGKGVDVEAEYLAIRLNQQSNVEKSKQQQGKTAERIFNNFPPLRLNCQRCEWEGKPLGSVQVNLSRHQNKIDINNFSLNYKKNKILASGQWTVDEGLSSSLIAGNLYSDDLGLWVREYDFSSPIRDSYIKSDFEFSWLGAPYQVNTESLAGKIKWTLGEGHLSEVSDQGARIFSLLSLESLVRKLRLDFRDIFSKGLFYNDIKGSMTIIDGIATTNDTFMDGLPGNMEIKGWTNLSNKDINYDVSFSPKVTSSIPIVVAWMVNPIAGVAALAIDKVLESAKVIYKLEYKLEGSLDKPKMEEIGRSSREVQLSKKATTETNKDTIDLELPKKKQDGSIEEENRPLDDSVPPTIQPDVLLDNTKPNLHMLPNVPLNNANTLVSAGL